MAAVYESKSAPAAPSVAYSDYGGRSYGRKAYRKKRSYKRTAPITRMRGEVKRIVARMEETRWQSYTNGGTFSTAAPAILLQNGLQLGAQRFQRLGNSVSMMKLNFALNIQSSVTAVLATRIRIMVVCDRQADATLIVCNDLFATGSAVNNFIDMFNLNNVPTRYSILYDEYAALEPSMVGVTAAGTTTAASSTVKFFKRTVPLRLLRGRYNDQNNGDVRDIINNAVYILVFTDQVAGGTAPAYACQSQILYKDA